MSIHITNGIVPGKTRHVCATKRGTKSHMLEQLMKTTYTTFGTCSSYIDIETEGDTVLAVRFIGGCPGNSKGVAALAAGRPIDEVIEKLKGISCRNGTSCPDQLSKALEELFMKNVSTG